MSGRKTQLFTITDDGRDKGKVFFLEEMSASRAEKWALRAFLALARAGVDIPENAMANGIAGIAVIGLKAFGNMNAADAEHLLDEMLACIQYVPDPQRAEIKRPIVESDIDEVATRFRLRMEVFTLHTGFSLADVASRLTSETASADLPNT
jgi:hypothetical protein